MIRLRESTREDVDRLFDIWRRAVEATHDFVSEADRREIAEIVRGRYLPSGRFMLAELDDFGTAGFMGWREQDGRGVIDALFVDPRAHRRGVGRALAEWAMARYDTVTLDVNEQNPEAVRFYEALGFSVTGRSEADAAGRPYPLVHMAWTR